MNRHAQFVAIVQAAAVAQVVVSAATLAKYQSKVVSEDVVDIIDVVGAAVAVDEDAIPHDVIQAAREFLAWVFDPKGTEPEWHREWREVESG